MCIRDSPDGLLKVGMFAEVSFQIRDDAGKSGRDRELVVPSESIQRIGERTIVFIPKQGEAGHYLVRDVEAGAETEGFTRILHGLTAGEKVVSDGGFTLKSHLLRGDLKEE